MQVSDMPDAGWRAALRYLQAEETLLLAADFRGLIQHQDSRADAFMALSLSDLDADRLQVLRAMAARNQSLAAALHAGVCDARGKLADLLHPPSFKAYGPDGSRQKLGGSEPGWAAQR
jgi:hypothetical protein